MEGFGGSLQMRGKHVDSMSIENEQKRYDRLSVFEALQYLAVYWNDSQNTDEMTNWLLLVQIRS